MENFAVCMDIIYKTYSFRVGAIASDTETGRTDYRTLLDAKGRFLDALASEGFEVLVDNSSVCFGFPSQIVVGGERTKQQRVRELSTELKLGDYLSPSDPSYIKHSQNGNRTEN